MPQAVPFIVMEYVEGHTVRDILKGDVAAPIDEAVEIVAGVLAALDYSHHAGLVHRDIKPANVMLTPTGAVKVMDFGIARALADAGQTMTQTPGRRRHGPVPVARAGARRERRRALGPVLDGLPALRAAHGPSAVHRRLARLVAVEPATLAFGRADGAKWTAARTLTVRNVSSRPLTVGLGLLPDDPAGRSSRSRPSPRSSS